MYPCVHAVSSLCPIFFYFTCQTARSVHNTGRSGPGGSRHSVRLINVFVFSVVSLGVSEGAVKVIEFDLNTSQ